MFLIVLLLSLTALASSSDPSEVFISVDESYFNENKEINIAAGSNLALTCSSTVTGSSSDVTYKWYLSSVPYTSQQDQRSLVSSSKEYSVTANSTHTGYYMCLISSEEGYAVFTPILHVEIQYFDITTEHDSATIEPYEKVSVLKCSSINAYPTPVVTWKKDGINVNNINLDSNIMHVTGKVVDKSYDIAINDLVIVNYIAEYAGTYTCEVEATGTLYTGQTATAKSYTVRTAASTNKMTDNSTQILFIDNGGDPSIGDAITLKCGASGYPTPSYQWFDVNDNLLTKSDAYEVLEATHSLKVKSIQAADDDAEYKCKAKSGDSEYIEAIRLTLADVTPAFNSSMDNSQYNIPGATITIDFGLKTTGQLDLKWNGAGLGEFVNEPGRGTLSFDSDTYILKISDIQKNASGVFQAIVYNEAGVVTQYKTVIIRDAQPAEVAHTTASTDDITVIGNDIHSIRGANFTMQCTGSGNPTPSDITIDVPDSTNVGSNLVKVNSEGKYIGNLLIDSVNEDYAGNYNCCTHNFLSGVRHEACVTISLAVEEEVSVTQNSYDSDYSLVLGNQVYGTTGYELAAQCKATGLPRPTINATLVNNCGTVSTITKSNDIELVDHVIIEVKLSNTSACITQTFHCCGNNTIQGRLNTKCSESITMSFVDQEKPNDVKIENLGNLAAADDSLVSTLETLLLNCSAKSFPESEFVWMYKNTDDGDSTFQAMNSVDFPTSSVKSKGFTYSILSTNGFSRDHLSGENYQFQCTASNVFGEATATKVIKITESTNSEVSSSVYLGVGLFLFIAALVAIFVMYIFFIISSGKKKKGDLGAMSWIVCKCCEPKEQPVDPHPNFDYKLLTLEKVATNSFNVPLYSHPRLVTVESDEFRRAPVYRELEQMTMQTNSLAQYEPLY